MDELTDLNWLALFYSIVHNVGARQALVAMRGKKVWCTDNYVTK